MLARRLHMARKRAGLSLRELAEAAGGVVSAQAIGRYERGEMNPGSRALLALAKALDVSLDYLFSPLEVELGDIQFRRQKDGNASKFECARAQAELDRIKAEVLDQVQRYLEVEEILGEDSASFCLPKGFPWRVRSMEEAEEAAEHLRQVWELGINPIPSMTELLEEKGVKVFLFDAGESGVDAMLTKTTLDFSRMSGGPIPIIASCTHKSVERYRFNLAHELGHQMMEIGEGSAAFANLRQVEEKVCHRFAGAFLAPRQALERELGKSRSRFSYTEFIQIKHYFGISAAALVFRLKDIGILSQADMRRIFSTFGSPWLKEEPLPLSTSFFFEHPRRFERLVLRALAEKEISLLKAAELLRKTTDEIEDLYDGPSGESLLPTEGRLRVVKSERGKR